MNKEKINRIFLILLTGLLSCLMMSMLYLGGGMNLKCFLGAEKVYDFPKEDLTKNSKGWEYHGDAEGYSIVKNNAVNKYRVGRSTGKWKCLYITMDKMNVPVLYATLEYYNNKKELLLEQPVELSLGENIIFLNEELPFYRLGIRIRDSKGTFFYIQSMQARSGINGFTPKRFAKAMIASGTAFLLLFAVGMLWHRKRGGREQKEHTGNPLPLSVLQNIFCIPGNFFGAWIKGRETKKQRQWLLGGSFFLLFLWILICNATGFGEEETYRYFALVCVVFLVLAALLMWEKPFAEVNWRNPLALSWCGLWLMVIVSDIFVDAGNKFFGYIMLFAAGFFLFSWNQTENPRRVLQLMMWALEADFVLAVIFCMLFRQKKTAVYYNGIFQTSEEMAMYALLMFGIFFAEFLDVLKKKRSLGVWLISGSGAAVSLYLALCSGGVTACIALAVLTAVMFGIKIRHLLRRENESAKFRRGQAVRMLFTATAALLLTAAVHAMLQKLPETLGTDMQIEDEQLISRLSSEELTLYQLLLPEELENAVSEDTLEIGLYQKSYARMIGLVGNIEQIYVYREPVSAYNGYLAVMYRYGIYAVLPFLLYQIWAVHTALGNCLREERKEHLWILAVDIAYIAFCIGGNAQIVWNSPLVWCFFLINGYSFFRKS